MNLNLYRDLAVPVRARRWDAGNRAAVTATSVGSSGETT
jgi:hypothetical protein